MCHLIERFERIASSDPHRFLELGTKVLSENATWDRDVLDCLENISGDSMILGAQSVNVPQVEPCVIPLYRWDNGMLLVANHYRADRFKEQFSAGRITPHYHHFHFVSKVLRGQLTHFRFLNDGTPTDPRLEPNGFELLVQGQAFSLTSPDYHCVLISQGEATTLMLRSAPLFTNPFVSANAFAADEVVERRNAIVRMLRSDDRVGLASSVCGPQSIDHKRL